MSSMTGFSRQPHAIDATRAFLIDHARRRDPELPRYGDVAAQYGGIARAAGPVLNSVRKQCDERGEPDLSALVVDRATGLPGTFRGRPIEPGSAAERAWRDELERI